jgi:hypothetical protein
VACDRDGHLIQHLYLPSERKSDMKKKVRYAVGALGVMPALGLAAPAVAATNASPATAGKTVSLVPSHPACNARNAGNYSLGMSGHIVYSKDNGCIGSVYGRIAIQNPPTGLWMRVRFYANGHSLHHNMNKHGHIGYHSIHWSSNPYLTGVQQVCEAVVPADASTRVLYGPVCQQTGF